MRWPWKKKKRSIADEIRLYRRWPRRLKFHREGVWLLIMIFGLGIAATNTGHNLLYLLLGFLMSLIMLSGVLSERVLKKTSVDFEVPVGVFAHEPVRIPTWIRNERNRGRIYSLRALPMMEPKLVETVPAYAPEIEAKGKKRQILRLKFNRRGLHTSDAARIETDFPFGLVCKSRVQLGSVAFRVWPKVHKVHLRETSSSNLEEQQPATRVSATGVEFFGIREYRPGDPPQRIHWRHTARAKRTIVREFERPKTPEMRIRCHIPCTDDEELEDRFAEIAASLAVAGLDAGFRVALRTRDLEIAAGVGLAHRHKILDALSQEAPSGTLATGGVWMESFDRAGQEMDVDVQWEGPVYWDPVSGAVNK